MLSALFSVIQLLVLFTCINLASFCCLERHFCSSSKCSAILFFHLVIMFVQFKLTNYFNLVQIQSIILVSSILYEHEYVIPIRLPNMTNFKNKKHVHNYVKPKHNYFLSVVVVKQCVEEKNSIIIKKYIIILFIF